MENQHFSDTLEQRDPIIADALKGERQRQQTHIEMIASENIVSKAVLEALGSPITNKTVEGYPANRFHGGAGFADIVEQTAIDRAKQLFGCTYANVQPHSGSQANQAVFYSLLNPHDKILSLDLTAGGHLSHGSKANLSGRIYESYHYYVDKESGLIDYRTVEQLSLQIQPKILIAGGSAYPREIDFERMRSIADMANAYLLVDMAHFAGLVAAGVHPSPIKFADVVTLTTTKTMRGARGGVILSNREDLFKRLQTGVFPGIQGSAHLQVIAAKAVCLGEALKPEFKKYGKQVLDNARTLAQKIKERGNKVVSGGTDTHLVLIDVSEKGLTGQQAQDILAEVNITSNKNPVPYDSTNPKKWVGLRLGTGAGTTRGFKAEEFRSIGDWIGDLFECISDETERRRQKISDISLKVSNLCAEFPIYN